MSLSKTKQALVLAREIVEQEATLVGKRRQLSQLLPVALPELILEELLKVAGALTPDQVGKRIEASSVFVSVLQVETVLTRLVARQQLKRSGEKFEALRPDVLSRHLSQTPTEPRATAKKKT
jgi:hypothetical protein